MNRNQFLLLLRKYETGSATLEEEQLIEKFLESYESEIPGIESSQLLKYKHQIRKGIKSRIYSKSRANIFSYWRVAAIIIFILGLSWWVRQYPEQGKLQRTEIAWITKKTKKGQKLTIKLPDGSRVKLNAASSISFPISFTEDIREVKLQGEAFFEVIKNPEKVFVVKSAGLQTQVLGTKFNVSNYQHERASVTVLSGKVQVRSKTTREPVTLVKDERVTYLSHSGDLIKDHVDAAALASWTQGIIHFDNTSLRHVAQVLERWYGVSVVFENEEAKSCTISGKYINPTLESVLESIQFVKGLDYAIDEYQVTLKGKNCES